MATRSRVRIHSRSNTQDPIADTSTDNAAPPVPVICKAWIAAFLDYGIYMRGWSAGTCRTYQQGLATLTGVPLTKAGLIDWMRTQQQRGLTPGGINMYARSINSFLSFAREEGWITERVRVRLLPDPPKPIMPITDTEIRRLLVFRPHGRTQRRTWTLVILLLDTGLRLSEALGIDRGHVDLHNCMIRVRGKGNRERLVPLSLECRKRIYLLLKTSKADPVFATSSGLRVTSRNRYRAIKRTCQAAGVSGRHIHPHAFRRCFAVTYIRRGGGIYRLSRLLGHASIVTTQRYLRSMGVDAITEGHQQLSPLSPAPELRLRSV